MYFGTKTEQMRGRNNVKTKPYAIPFIRKVVVSGHILERLLTMSRHCDIMFLVWS